MAKINVESGGTILSSGLLQLSGGAAMSATLTAVTDQNNTASPLKLSTTSVQVTSPLRITTDDPSDFYLDCEDGSTNNRFSIKRNTASQQVNVDFASNPGSSTEIVGGIRTYVDGVNLSNVMQFRRDGQLQIGSTAGSAMYWDNTNNRLGVGTTSPTAKTHIKGSGSTSATTSLLVQNSGGTTALQVFDDLVVRSDNSQLLFTNASPTHRIGLFQFNSGTLSNFTVLNLSGTGGVSFQDPTIYFATNSILNLGNFIPGNNTRVGLSIGGNYTNSGAGGSSFGTCFNFNTSLNTSVGTITFNHISVTNSINTTGGTTLHRGFYYNPTITGTTGLTNYAIQTTSGGAYINTTTPQASACLQADSTTQGFLAPRMTNAQRLAIASPAVGLMVYCTDAVEGLYVYKSTGWTFVI